MSEVFVKVEGKWTDDPAALADAFRLAARRDDVQTKLIAELDAEIVRLREEQRWIPVGERLPELNEENDFRLNCLACCKGGLVCEMVYEINTYAKRERHRQPRWKWCGTISMREVTHWQPLPRGADRE